MEVLPGSGTRRVRLDDACGLTAGRQKPRQKRVPAGPTETGILGAAVRVAGGECRCRIDRDRPGPEEEAREVLGEAMGETGEPHGHQLLQ